MWSDHSVLLRKATSCPCRFLIFLNFLFVLAIIIKHKKFSFYLGDFFYLCATKKTWNITKFFIKGIKRIFWPVFFLIFLVPSIEKILYPPLQNGLMEEFLRDYNHSLPLVFLLWYHMISFFTNFINLFLKVALLLFRLSIRK